MNKTVELTEAERTMLALAAKWAVKKMEANKRADPDGFEDMGFDSDLEALERAQSKLS